MVLVLASTGAAPYARTAGRQGVRSVLLELAAVLAGQLAQERVVQVLADRDAVDGHALQRVPRAHADQDLVRRVGLVVRGGRRAVRHQEDRVELDAVVLVLAAAA